MKKRNLLSFVLAFVFALSAALAVNACTKKAEETPMETEETGE